MLPVLGFWLDQLHNRAPKGLSRIQTRVLNIGQTVKETSLKVEASLVLSYSFPYSKGAGLSVSLTRIRLLLMDRLSTLFFPLGYLQGER